MNFLAGKSPRERNQIIVLIVVGTLALLAVGYNFSSMFYGGKKTVSVTVNTSPSPTAKTAAARQNPTMPTQNEVYFEYTTTPVYYNPSSFNAPGPGRNIFAFFEPPRPTPYSPTPPPTPTPFIPPTPTPTPPIFLTGVSPASVYAGQGEFTIQIRGDRLTEDSIILINGYRLEGTAVPSQGIIFAQVRRDLIATAGVRNISVVTPDGKFSNTRTLNVQEPPKPPFEYIGLIGRKLNNNDTAYFQMGSSNSDPVGARLNDVISGFRLKSISADEVIFEDVNLGFRHPLKLKRDAPGTSSAGSQGGRNNFGNPTIIPDNPRPAGIPEGIPIYNPTPMPTPDDGDINDDGDNN